MFIYFINAFMAAIKFDALGRPLMAVILFYVAAIAIK